MPRHAHEYAYLSFLLHGSYTEQDVARGQHTSSPGTAQFYLAGVEHSDQVHNLPAVLLLIKFPEEWIREVQALGLPLQRMRSNAPEVAATGFRLRRELLDDTPASAMTCEGLVLELFSQLVGSSDRYHCKWLYDARDLIHARFSEPLGLGEVARSLGLHPAHLARAFKQHFGCTVGSYIRRVRTDFARDQLEGTDKPISEIAALGGFADQSHLTRLFRQSYGTTPRLFRKTRGRSQRNMIWLPGRDEFVPRVAEETSIRSPDKRRWREN